MNFLGFAIASSLGAVVRFWLERNSVHRFGQRLHWGTLAANVLGSAWLGWFAAGDFGDSVNLLAAAFAGAFTTFGGFIGQSYERLRHSDTRLAGSLYLVASVGLSIAAAALGFSLNG